MRDFVTCKMCGIERKFLWRHLKFEHNLTVAEYRVKFPDAEVVSPAKVQGLKDKPSWNRGLTKDIDTRVQRGTERAIVTKGKQTKEKKQEIAAKIAKTKIGIKRDPDMTARMAATLKILRNTPEWKKEQSDKLKDAWNDPVKASHMLLGRTRRPNKIEISLTSLFGRWFPGKIAYTGCNKTVGRFMPDFWIVDTNCYIDYFGDYWHDNEEALERVKQFELLGCKLLIIWESNYQRNGNEWLQQTVDAYLKISLDHNTGNQQPIQGSDSLEGSTVRGVPSQVDDEPSTKAEISSKEKNKEEIRYDLNCRETCRS